MKSCSLVTLVGITQTLRHVSIPVHMAINIAPATTHVRLGVSVPCEIPAPC